MHVLIVAQPGMLRDGLEIALASWLDAELLSVECDERQVEAALQAAPPDLVILDAESAGAASVRCVRAIRRLALQVPLIVLVDRSGRARVVLDAGADRVLLRGFALTELADTVRQLCPQVTDGQIAALGKQREGEYSGSDG